MTKSSRAIGPRECLCCPAKSGAEASASLFVVPVTLELSKNGRVVHSVRPHHRRQYPWSDGDLPGIVGFRDQSRNHQRPNTGARQRARHTRAPASAEGFLIPAGIRKAISHVLADFLPAFELEAKGRLVNRSFAPRSFSGALQVRPHPWLRIVPRLSQSSGVGTQVTSLHPLVRRLAWTYPVQG